MSIGIPPLLPIPGHSSLLIQIVPNSTRYHFRLNGFWELFKHEEVGNVSIGKEDFASITELRRSVDEILTRELRKNKPASITIRTLITEYLSKLFPDDRDEITEDARDVSSPILQDIHGIGPKVAGELRKHGIADVQQLARAPEEVLQQDVKFLGEKTAKKVREAAQKEIHKNQTDGNKKNSIQELRDRLGT